MDHVGDVKCCDDPAFLHKFHQVLKTASVFTKSKIVIVLTNAGAKFSSVIKNDCYIIDLIFEAVIP